MRRSLNKRLDSVEPTIAGNVLSPAATVMLAAVYGKMHALFLPYRSHLNSWPSINSLRRGYIAGSVGISAAVSGHRNWVEGHDARRELESAGLAVAVKGTTETTGLILTSRGRSTALSMCRDLLPTLVMSGEMVAHLETMQPCRVRGSERWVSESKLFGGSCSGPTSDWQGWTDMLLEPSASGAVDSLADVQGHVFYRYLGPFEELPVVHGVEVSPAAEDSYLSAWKSEIARLRSLDPVDGEICIPLSCS